MRVANRLRRLLTAIDLPLLLIVLAAAALRLQTAATLAPIHDEVNTSLPLAQSISLDPARLNLPLRAVNHGALPAYFVKISSLVAGETLIGYRAAHVVIGLCTILLIYALTRQWYDVVAARCAALLLAFNEYFVAVSSRATAHAPYLLFVAAALYAFSRFLASGRPGYLYAAGAAVGVGFYAKEHIVLLLPVFFLTLVVLPSGRRWLRGPHPYVACALFGLLIAPDVSWNLRANPEVDRVTYGNRDVAQATYGRHLQRFGGISFSPYPLTFYSRSLVQPAYRAITGRELDDNTPEYHAMNPGVGLLLLGAVIATLWWRRRDGEPRVFLLLAFGVVFVLFTLIEPGDPEGLDPVNWMWVDATMFPAVVLAGARASEARGWIRLACWGAGAASLGYAVLVMLRAM